jgi:flavin-dependent dehydrogenase
METCDVLIVGGGPAGSSCARKLRRAGLDVIVMDRAVFPRDKVCAGWITPQVITDAGIDCDDYRRGRTLQPVAGFRTGLIGGHGEVETVYDRPVSYGIRRCEFDQYLLQRSDARLKLGTQISSIRTDGRQWVINDSVRAAVLVGAGGHFCPVARWLNPTIDREPLVVAQEAEFRIEPRDAASWTAAPGTPELYFCRDLKGYGWCFRKGQYLNVGLGRLIPKGT